jgi:anti-sigma regulatory factor (Ser/Thr protein kinase)
MNSSGLKGLLSLIDKIPIDDSLSRTNIADPLPFLKFLETAVEKRVTIDDFQVLQPWAITALAALANHPEAKVYVENLHDKPCAKFAASLGLDDIVNGTEVHGAPEVGRTVKLTRVTNFADIEPVSGNIAKLIVSDSLTDLKNQYLDADEVRSTIRYVMVELLRNVIQHSYDERGGIILAQRMDHGIEPSIQVAVVDCGIGIQSSLSTTHKDISSPEVALERSIWPSYSGTFHKGQAGSAQNAGMGLFFASEMAKLASGKLLICSRGASLLIQGDPECRGNNKIDLLKTGFPGTLAAFEIPKRGVSDYDALIKKIIDIAGERQKKEITHRWARYDIPEQEVIEFVITVASENTVEAEKFSKEQLIPRIKARQSLRLNFVNVTICTQSFMHALLFEALRTAFELKVPLYIKNASESVKDGIRLVEMYGL